MAATTSAFASLQAPSHEDTMDMSSPAQRHDDNDIDIDIDFTYNEDTLVVDDQMLDDEHTRPQTATDTAMDDDAEQDITLVQEADMMDDPDLDIPDETVVDAPIEEDDELIDYGEDDYLADELLQDAAPEESVAVTTAVDEQHQGNSVEQVDYESPHETGDLATGSKTADGAIGKSRGDVAEKTGDQQASITQKAPRDEHDVLDGGSNEQTNGKSQIDAPQQDEVVTAAAQFEGERNHVDETSVGESASAAFTETRTRRASDVPASPTDTGLHHMILQFGHIEIPLFRSRQSLEGLLTNDNLVGHHLADLISSCKERLQETENVVFSEHEDCMLQFQGLPLILRESSKAAYKCTLNDVLDVFLLLHNNAGTNPIPPLFLTLSIPETFTDVLESLRLAAGSGQGIPNVQYNEENIEADRYLEETGEEHKAEGELQDHYHEQYSEEVDGNSNMDQGEGPYTEGDNDHYTDEHEAEETGNTYELDGDDVEQREEINNAVEGEDITYEDPLASSPGAASGRSSSVAVERPSDVPTSAQSEHVVATFGHVQQHKATSSGSSATAQNDDGQTFAGEYETDLEFINWDEDNPLINDASDITDDSSITHAIDPTVDEPTAEIEQRETSTVNDVLTVELEDQGAAQNAPQSVLEEEFEDETEAVEHHEYHLGADNEAEDYGEDHRSAGDQTDIYDEQHNEYQSGIEDEQYHTARDFLNGQTDQHGPVDDPDESDVINEGHSQVEATSVAAADNYDDPNEVIDFDDDTPAEHEARKGSPVVTGVVTTDSPLGKRSFDEHADEDLYDDDEPELKKARSH